MNLVKFILRGKLDGHTNLFNTQALFYAVLPHRVKVINVYPMGAYFNKYLDVCIVTVSSKSHIYGIWTIKSQIFKV